MQKASNIFDKEIGFIFESCCFINSGGILKINLFSEVFVCVRERACARSLVLGAVLAAVSFFAAGDDCKPVRSLLWAGGVCPGLMRCALLPNGGECGQIRTLDSGARSL